MDTREYKKTRMKCKIEEILGSLLETNRDYTVEAYVCNSMTDSIVGQLFITKDRIARADDNSFTLEWDIGCDVKSNRFTIRFDEVMACYKEVDEYGSQIVSVVMKCGILVNFECIGLII